MKMKLCHRTVSAGNYEPSQCIGPQCTLYGKVGGVEGCMEANLVMFNCIDFVNRQSQKSPEKPKDVQVAEVPEEIVKKAEAKVYNKKKTVDNKEKKDAGKTDSGTGNILEGGNDSPEKHDSNGSSSSS